MSMFISALAESNYLNEIIGSCTPGENLTGRTPIKLEMNKINLTSGTKMDHLTCWTQMTSGTIMKWTVIGLRPKIEMYRKRLRLV